jgi:hypothetical protein
MNYEIIRKWSEQDSTGYMEIGPGKYSGKHWQDGFLFIKEDSFGIAEGIVMKHFKDYDHYGMNDIPKDIGDIIATEWANVASALNETSGEECMELLNLDIVYRASMQKEVAENKEQIINLLMELANAFQQYYRKEEWVCILGM